jgi:hypothetical protein
MDQLDYWQAIEDGAEFEEEPKKKKKKIRHKDKSNSALQMYMFTMAKLKRLKGLI